MNTFQSSHLHAESVFCLCCMLPEGLSLLKYLCYVLYLVQSLSFPSVLPSFLTLPHQSNKTAKMKQGI